MITFLHTNPKYGTGELSYEGTKLKETEKAMCFEIGGGKVWFPKSALKFTDDSTVEVAKWFKYDDRVWTIIEPVSQFFA